MLRRVEVSAVVVTHGHMDIFHLLKLMSRAPTDCVQWHTGTSGNVLSYNHAGGQLLNKQIYNNCIRTEKGELTLSNLKYTHYPLPRLLQNPVERVLH